MGDWLGYALCALVLYRLVTAFLNALFPVRLAEAAHQSLQSVSILVPLRNEAWQLDALWQSLEPLYAEVHELVFYDDQSTDGTAAWLVAKAAAYPHLRVLHGRPLPAGWHGKHHACHQLAAAATGKYWLFLDADVRLQPDFLRSCVARLVNRRLDLLSAFPQQQYGSFGEALWVGMMPNLLLSWLWLKGRNRLQHPWTAAANGQFMLFQATSYQQYQWHAACKGQVAEDLAIARRLVRQRGRLEVLQAGSGLHCRMYRHGREAFSGLIRNVVPAMGSWPLALLLWLLQGSAWLWLALEKPQQLLLLFLLLFVSRIFVLLASREKPFEQLLLWPIQQFAWQFLWCFGIYAHLTRRIHWKDRPVR